MSLIGTDYVNLVDSMKEQTDKDLIELLSETNDIIKDAHYQPCNAGKGGTTNHNVTVRNGLPKATWVKYYEGVTPSKGTTTVVTVSTGMLKAYSEVDEDLVLDNPNPAKFRLNQAKAHLEAMNQEMQHQIFYGEKKKGAAFDGIANLYDSISTDKTKIGYNVIDAGGTTGALTSIYLVCWRDTGISLIYPENGKAGLEHVDNGVIKATAPNGGKFNVYSDDYKWKLGVAVEDWRCSGRICNIPVDEAERKELGIDLAKLMRHLVRKVKKHANGGKLFFYMNSDIIDAFEDQILDKNNIQFTMGEYLGEQVEMFKKIPLREIDQISLEEKKVA